MIDIPNNLIFAVGMLNKACTEANVSWQILKYPGEHEYTAMLCPKSGDIGADTFKAEYIDDLFERMIEQAGVFARSN